VIGGEEGAWLGVAKLWDPEGAGQGRGRGRLGWIWGPRTEWSRSLWCSW
jgi:hypothetical protein